MTPSLPSSHDRGLGEIHQTNINLYCRLILNLKYRLILRTKPWPSHLALNVLQISLFCSTTYTVGLVL